MRLLLFTFLSATSEGPNFVVSLLTLVTIFLITATVLGVKCSLIVVMICMSLMAGVGHLSMCLLASLLLIIWLSHSEKERVPEEVHLFLKLSEPHFHYRGIYLIPTKAVTFQYGISICLRSCVRPGLACVMILSTPVFGVFLSLLLSCPPSSTCHRGHDPSQLPAHLTRAARSWHALKSLPLLCVRT